MIDLLSPGTTGAKPAVRLCAGERLEGSATFCFPEIACVRESESFPRPVEPLAVSIVVVRA
jgi:hypothetical protein